MQSPQKFLRSKIPAVLILVGILFLPDRILEAKRKTRPRAKAKTLVRAPCPKKLALILAKPAALAPPRDVRRDGPEIVTLDRPFSQVPYTPVVELSNLNGRLTMGAPGTGASAFEFFPQKNSGHLQLAPSQLALPLAVGRQTSHALAEPYQGGSSQLPDVRVIMKQFIRDIDLSSPPATVNKVVKAALGDTELLARATVHWRENYSGSASGSSGRVRLTNQGTDRYFTFTPTGGNSVVAARVLDMNPTENNGVHILVEILGDSPPDGPRTRHVRMLEESEVATIQPLSPEQKMAIEAQFDDSLSPDELIARKLARILGLRTFSYANFDRAQETRSEVWLRDPLTKASNLSHLASRGDFIKAFAGNPLEDLLTKGERGTPYWNIYDVFARLNPGYALKRFSYPGVNLLYVFVITEDGTLKIAPHGRGTINLKPQSLRLAHTRHVFLAGTFSVNQDGDLDILLESNSYQASNCSPNDFGFAFRQGNGDIDHFLRFVFMNQAGRRVASSNSEPFDASEFRAASDGSAGFEDQGRSGTHTNGRKFAADLFSGAQAPEKTIEWDRGVGSIPLELRPWVKEVGLNPRMPRLPLETQIFWAHYVLQTTSKMNRAEIRAQFNKLSKRFHPDPAGSREGNENAFKSVGSAWHILDNALK